METGRRELWASAILVGATVVCDLGVVALLCNKIFLFYFIHRPARCSNAVRVKRPDS